MKCLWLCKDYTARVILQNLSVCSPNKCLECVKHGVEWPQEEKSIAIHISYVYNCLWKHGSGLFAGQLSLSCCFLSFLISNGHVFHMLCCTVKQNLGFLSCPHYHSYCGTLYWIWSVHWTVDGHRLYTRNGYFALRYLKVWVFHYLFCFEAGEGEGDCVRNLSSGELFIYWGFKHQI